MMQHRAVRVSFHEIAWLAVCAALIAGAFLYGNADTRDPLSSAETRFVEISPSGLQIVPASCPSNPHQGGSCSGNGSCNLYFSPSPVAQSQASTLFWSAPSGYDPYTLSYPSGSHTVSSWGSGAVGGESSKTYTLSYKSFSSGGGANDEGGHNQGSTVSCSATLTVCPAGQVVQNGQCVAQGGACTIAFNPAFVNADGPSTLSWNAPAAGTMSYPGGSFPVSAGSASGAVGGGAAGVNKTYTLSGGGGGGGGGGGDGGGGAPAFSCSATLTACPTGTVANAGGTACIPVGGQCTEQYFCQGNDLYRRTAQCTNQFVEACTWGCSGGGCLAAPPGSGNITASPALIHSGETSQISWTTENMQEDSCTVTENNQDINDSWIGNSGTRASSAIAQQTVYTLRCTGLDDEAFTDSVIVNIIPIENEE